jgi:hypothetical protein
VLLDLVWGYIIVSKVRPGGTRRAAPTSASRCFR